MTRKTLRLASSRSLSTAAPARKAGVRMVKSRVRAGQEPSPPAGTTSGKPAGKGRPTAAAERDKRPDGRRSHSGAKQASRRSGPDVTQSRPWSASGPSSPEVRTTVEGTIRRRPRHDAPRADLQPSRQTLPVAALAVVEAVSGPVRVSKLLAERGLCSRREADEFIVKGWVWADGERVTRLGTRAAMDAELHLDPKALAARVRLATILLNKPVGLVSGQPEDDHPPAITLIRPENLWRDSPPAAGSRTLRFDPTHLRGLAPAGRLDIDSTGLLVLTQDGTVARHLIGAESDVEKEYLVRVEGEPVAGGLELLRQGLELDGHVLRPAEVDWLNSDQLRFILREGRKRQIRRMCEKVGLRVTGLKRVRIGGVVLGELPVGHWRYLGAGERF